ncbi:hypothetical protein FB451DRAFT_698806 [Mycena latifolia]|nr:hypothetical protein FB451DRAFT_698806 [Mycena latifolia]
MDPFACGAPVAADPDETPLNVTARLQELQNSNESPLDSERPFIESVVCQLRGRLSRRDVEISRLRARIAQLEEECAGLESEISRNTSILSPIRRIPNEILSEIFPLALPSHQEAIESDGFDVQDTPWSLGQICGQWRAVALSLGALWSSVAINYGAVVGSPSAAYPLAMLETQLERANTLRIYLTPTLSPSGHELVLLHLLAGHSHRWEVLDLVLTPGIHPIIASLQNRVPQLRKLRIEWRDPDPDMDPLLLPDEDVESFRVAPALKDVTLIVEDRLLSVPLPAHQLTRYELNGSWATHVDILKRAINLIEARIVVDDTADSPHIVPDGVIDLCHLRRLYVSDADILDGLRLAGIAGTRLLS